MVFARSSIPCLFSGGSMEFIKQPAVNHILTHTREENGGKVKLFEDAPFEVLTSSLRISKVRAVGIRADANMDNVKLVLFSGSLEGVNSVPLTTMESDASWPRNQRNHIIVVERGNVRIGQIYIAQETSPWNTSMGSPKLLELEGFLLNWGIIWPPEWP